MSDLKGRHYRTAIGCFVVVVDAIVFLVEHVFHRTATWGWEETLGHVAFAGVGVLLIDPKSGRELLSMLPWSKGDG